MNVTLTLAFLAGLVSFLSPCVLPLVPAYIGYMGGRVTNTVAAQTAAQTIGIGVGGAAVMTRPTLSTRLNTFTHGLMFVLGFTLVFVSLGLALTAFVAVIGRQNVNAVTEVISRLGGVIIIFFGLNSMGVMPSLFKRFLASTALISSPITALVFLVIAGVIFLWALVDWLLVVPVVALLGLWMFLKGAFSTPQTFWQNTIASLQGVMYSDTRREMNANGKGGYFASLLMGVVFSAGWTPCIGPIYGAILTSALTGGSASQAGLQLTAYSLGLGIPFLLTALLLDGAQGTLRRLQRHIRKIELFTGALLVLIGVLVATGNLQRLSQNFGNVFADFSYNLEDCVYKATEGQITWGEFLPCVAGTLASADEAAVDGGAAPAADTGALPGISDLAAEGGAVTGVNVGNAAPDFATMDDSGNAFRLSDLRGEVVLLNFWATWCGPCRAEMPAFEAAYQANAGRGFTIVGVNFGEAPDVVNAFRAEQNVTYPLVMDENAAVQDMYAISGYPTSYLIGRDGVILARSLGELTTDEIDQWITDALAG